jgi:hypothetical protein
VETSWLCSVIHNISPVDHTKSGIVNPRIVGGLSTSTSPRSSLRIGDGYEQSPFPATNEVPRASEWCSWSSSPLSAPVRFGTFCNTGVVGPPGSSFAAFGRRHILWQQRSSTFHKAPGRVTKCLGKKCFRRQCRSSIGPSGRQYRLVLWQYLTGITLFYCLNMWF